MDWGEQIVIVTGGTSTSCVECINLGIRSDTEVLSGSSGIGELIANTLAVRNVTVIVLDVKPIVSENCECSYCAAVGISG